MIYQWIGRTVIKAAKYYIGSRYGRELRVGAGVFVVALGVGAYLLSRDVKEG